MFKPGDKVIALQSISDYYTFKPLIGKGSRYTVDHIEELRDIRYLVFKEVSVSSFRFHDIKFEKERVFKLKQIEICSKRETL